MVIEKHFHSRSKSQLGNIWKAISMELDASQCKNSRVHFSVTVQGCTVAGGDHLEIIRSHVWVHHYDLETSGGSRRQRHFTKSMNAIMCKLSCLRIKTPSPKRLSVFLYENDPNYTDKSTPTTAKRQTCTPPA